jgi:hypothetical protein
MTDDLLEVLWRGGDPAKFTAIQAALRDESIPFWELQSHDHAGGFLSSRPYYLEAVPGFEIRVRSSDWQRAKGALQWVESKETAPFAQDSVEFGEIGQPTRQPALPIDWDPKQATSEVWAGEDESAADYLASALRENGIPSRIPDTAEHRVRIYVRPEDLSRAKDIVRQITEGRIPE